jgi:hypothetical protein
MVSMSVFSLVSLAGCTESDQKFLDELLNGTTEKAMRQKVIGSMPSNQAAMFARFKEACELYEIQPNEIKKSEVYRGAQQIYRGIGPIKDWSGVLRAISTDQGGTTAELRISMLESTVRVKGVRIGSPVYKSASELSENQVVVFSARSIRDHNLTERGKVCNPDFVMELTALRKLD